MRRCHSRFISHSPRSRLAVAILGLLVATSASSIANAQTAPKKDIRREQTGAKVVAETDPSGRADGWVDDSDRLDDAYQPKGIELGQFLFLPKIDLDETYNSNIYARTDDVRSDLITGIHPELKLRSRFDNHMLNLGAFVDDYRYADNQSENHLDTRVEADGRIDVSKATEVTGLLQQITRHEDRSSPDDRDGREPTRVETMNSRLGGKHKFGDFTLAGETGATHLSFEDVQTSAGNIIPNHDRNRWQYDAKVRTTYEMFPGYGAVAQVGANKRSYENNSDRNGYNRNSTGQEFLTGVAVDISQLIRGDFLVGYFTQDYEDNRLKDPSGMTVRATFNWTPTPRLIIVPALERSVTETTSVNVSSLVSTSANVMVRNEVRRNLLVSGFFGLTQDDYQGSTESTLTWEGWGRVTYALSPNVNVGSQLGYKTKNVDDGTGAFDQTTVMLRLGLQM